MIREVPFITLYGAASSNTGAAAPFANVQAVLNGLDSNKDGKLQPNELRAVLDGPTGLNFDVIAQLYVKALDTDMDGALGTNDVQAFMKKLDANGDSAISFSEML